MNIIPEAAIWCGGPLPGRIATIYSLTRVDSGDGMGNGYRRLWRRSFQEGWCKLREDAAGLAAFNDALDQESQRDLIRRTHFSLDI